MKPQFQDYIRAIRDISYDNYVQPAMLVLNKTEKELRLHITDEKLEIVDELKIPLVRQLSFFGFTPENFDPLNPSKVYEVFIPEEFSSQNLDFSFEEIDSPPTSLQVNHSRVGDVVTVTVPNFEQGQPDYVYTINLVFVRDTDITEVSVNGKPFPTFEPQYNSAGHTIHVYGNRFEGVNTLSIDTFRDSNIEVLSRESFRIDPDTLIETPIPEIDDTLLQHDLSMFYKTVYSIRVDNGASLANYQIILDYSPAPIILSLAQEEYSNENIISPQNPNTIILVDRGFSLSEFFEVVPLYSGAQASFTFTPSKEYLLSGLDYEYTTTFGQVILSGKILFRFKKAAVRVTPPYSLRTMYFDDYGSFGEFIKDFSNNSSILITEYWPTIVQSDIPHVLKEMFMTPIPKEPDPESLEEGNQESAPLVIGRRKFFSDDYVKNMMREYFRYFRSRFYTTTAKVIEEVEGLAEKDFAHICLYVAFYLIEDRRMFEAASELLVGLDDQLSLGGGSSFGAQRSQNMKLSLNIGSAFTLEDGGPEFSAGASKKPGGAAAQYGADNIIGDEDSFWYKLQAVIRKRFEDIYRQPHLRSNEIIEGIVEAVPTNDRNYLAFFDSFPHTLSPYSRGIFGANRTTLGSGASKNRVL